MSNSNTAMDEREKAAFLLEPGYIYFSQSPTVIKAVLGSCVAVCIWDKKLKHGGMNHFLHPLTNDPQKATAKFGNVAVSELIKMFEENGSRKKDLVAHVFGGGYPDWAESEDIGAKNVEVASRILRKKAVKIMSKDIGGSMGRKIIFDTLNGNVAVLKVETVRKADWHHYT